MNQRMIVSRKRAALFLALALPALFAGGMGWVLCIDSDGRIGVEHASQICCPATPAGAQRASAEATKSSTSSEVPECDSCLDLPLIALMPAIDATSDVHVLAWVQAQVFAGATPLPSAVEGVLPSFPGHDRLQRSAPSQLFARTISLRC
jgi:hypothetical protein